MHHFISGDTANVAGTELGVAEPQATFAPCVDGPFLAWYPSKHAELLATKMKQHKARAWLVNTGWIGRSHGTAQRIKLANTRGILHAIHNGSRAKVTTKRDAVFGFDVPAECPGVTTEILVPRNTWADKAAYDVAAKKLAALFRENFKTYAGGVGSEVRAEAPT